MLDYYQMLVELLGGLALFLFGMEILSENLKATAGSRLSTILASLTGNRFYGLLTGAGVTALIQSSSVTTVLLVGFVSTHVMTVQQSIAVIFGANIGTTITAQIVAFKITKHALLILSGGFFTFFIIKEERIKHYGGIALGLGMIFFGMGIMGSGMAPLQKNQAFLDLLTSMSNPLLAIPVAALFTALIQSSSATTGIIIVMAGQGLLTLEAGIALSIGANVGTCVTALLASIGRSVEALRVAMVHLFFNMAGSILWLPFITQFASLMVWISSGENQLPRQIANANTIFNIVNAILFLPFTGQIATMITRLFPDRHSSESTAPRYLDPILLQTPVYALEAVKRELEHLGLLAAHMTRAAIDPVLKGDQKSLEELREMDQGIKSLHFEIVAYLRKMARSRLHPGESMELSRFLVFSTNIETCTEIVQTDLITLGFERIRNRIVISPSTEDYIRNVHRMVSDLFEETAHIPCDTNHDRAVEIVMKKREVSRIIEEASEHQVKRLLVDKPEAVETYSLEMEILDRLKRIYQISRRIAKNSLPPEELKARVARKDRRKEEREKPV